MLRALNPEVSGSFFSEGDNLPPELVFTQLAGGVAHVVLQRFAAPGFAMLLRDELHRASALVLDLRRNRCGPERSSQAWCVLAYLMDQPFATLRWLRLGGQGQAQPAAAGTWSSTTARPFAGPVVLLLGRQTGAAGEDFAASFDAAHRGLLMGEPTGADGLGVPPHQRVQASSGDLQAGRDPLLLAAWQALQPALAARVMGG